jgi:hypothetical protein
MQGGVIVGSASPMKEAGSPVSPSKELSMSKGVDKSFTMDARPNLIHKRMAST